MKTARILFICLLLFAGACRADNRQLPRFEQANLAYSRGDYQQAIDQYLSCAEKNGVSAALLYNLANSYAAAGQTGRAVLNYKRALRLSPGDADIQANLEQVRKDAGLYRDDKPMYEQLAELLEADQWLLLASLSFVLLSLTALGSQLIRRPFPAVTRLLIIGALLVSLSSLPPALFRYRDWHDGVVTGEDCRLLLSPFPGAASTGSIKAGRLVHPGKIHGSYVRVIDETGRSGWLPQECFEQIAELPVINSGNRKT